MKTKNLILIFTASLILLFAGCSSNTDDAKTGGFFGGSIGTGTSQKGGSGVELKFADGQPGTEYNKGQPFNFGFLIENHQNHNINDLKIKISGIEWGYVHGLDEFKEGKQVDAIPQATVQSGPGIFSSLYMQGITVDNFVNRYNFNPKFDYCYTAKTQYREQVCVPSKTTNACTNVKVEPSIYQNGPLSIRIKNLRNYDAENLILDLEITNSLGGKVVKECFKTEEYANNYKINLVTLGTVQGDCSKTQGFPDTKIIGNSAVITCSFPRGADDAAYPSQLIAEIEYQYQQSTQKNILIKDYTATTN